ncbi:MAG TPA: indole-3-glycerol phosphate synthase TrpC [Vicinamibacterales bacterium]|nr:indole-3-glycerol phosphate synthase TrpC [Vicinamibacterales bacterium]
MADVLEAIIAATRRIVAVRREREPDGDLEARASQRQPQTGRFREALAVPGRVNVIAECKRRSPSRGVLRADYDPVAIAGSYQRAGAAALSILTEPTFFDGALEHLAAVREAVRLPLLRKDFVIDSYQLLEARANGADAVLLIVAALAESELRTLLSAARAFGLAALVEVHDAAELDRALDAGAEIIGVNNRNLRTLEVDLHVSEVAAARIPPTVVAVSESGLTSPDDVGRLRALGYRAFLIGERFMTSPDPGAALSTFLTMEGPGSRAMDSSSRVDIDTTT